VEVGGGTVRINQRAALRATEAHAVGYEARLRNVTFIGGSTLLWVNNTGSNRTFDLDNCSWYPNAESTDGIMRADVNTGDILTVRRLHIGRAGGSSPNGLVRAAADVTASLTVGEITLDGGASLPVKTSGAHASSVVTVKKLVGWGRRVQAPTGSVTVEDDAGLVLMSHTSGTPTLTLKDPALFPGREVTIKNLALSSGGNVTVAAAAGTISGATTLTAAGKERATYIANGTVWQQIA
jgi:hypothetical protein